MNNSIVQDRIVKSCVEACQEGCDGEELVLASIPGASIIKSVGYIAYDSDDTSGELKVGLTDDTNIVDETLDFTSDYKEKAIDNCIVPVGGLSVSLTLDTYPKEGKVCIFIKYLDPNSNVGVVDALIPVCTDCDNGCK